MASLALMWIQATYQASSQQRRADAAALVDSADAPHSKTGSSSSTSGRSPQQPAVPEHRGVPKPIVVVLVVPHLPHLTCMFSVSGSAVACTWQFMRADWRLCECCYMAPLQPRGVSSHACCNFSLTVCLRCSLVVCRVWPDREAVMQRVKHAASRLCARVVPPPSLRSSPPAEERGLRPGTSVISAAIEMQRPSRLYALPHATVSMSTPATLTVLHAWHDCMHLRGRVAMRRSRLARSVAPVN